MKIEGPEDLVEHGIGYMTLVGERPSSAKNLGDMTERLTAKKRKSLGFDDREATKILENVAFDLNVAAKLRASFVTERAIYISLLEQISGDNGLRERNQFVQRHLTSIVPFANELSFANLMKLRSSEGDAFENFRQSLNQSILEYRKQGRNFTEKDAIELHADVIAPKLAKLNTRVNAARRKINRAGISKIIGWAGAIGFGTYFGLIPHELVAAARLPALQKRLPTFSKFMPHTMPPTVPSGKRACIFCGGYAIFPFHNNGRQRICDLCV